MDEPCPRCNQPTYDDQDYYGPCAECRADLNMQVHALQTIREANGKWVDIPGPQLNEGWPIDKRPNPKNPDSWQYRMTRKRDKDGTLST